MKSVVYKRLIADGRWAEAAAIKDRLIRESRQRGMSKDDAAEAAYRTIDAMFPAAGHATPSSQAESTVDDAAMQTATFSDGGNEEQPGDDRQPREGQQPRAGQGDGSFLDEQRPTAASTGERGGRGESTVTGLSSIPADWPQLPPNASLGAEVAWVLANRIRVIREDKDGAVVDLTKALIPAPSYAALGWLETSIRAFAKFVDVSARASASGQDEADKVKRERLQIAEIRSLLEQMRQENARG